MNAFETDQPAEGLPAETLASTPAKSVKSDWNFAGKPPRVLFLCTNNSARSPMAETLLRHLSQGQVEVFSAGSTPAAQVDPEAVRALSRLGVDMRQYVPKNVDQLRAQSFDHVIVLCDAEKETCPIFPGAADTITWTIPDPLSAQAPVQDRSRAFDYLAIELNTRIRLLLTVLERESRVNV
ncbi:MAG TPA: arsenate reductase ArsC [Ktedonobacteraceae bacterium]